MKENRFWSTYIIGLGVGLVLLGTFYFAGRGLGASGAYSLIAGVGLHAVAPAYANSLTYFSQYLNRPSPLLTWNIFLIVGVFVGALLSALFSGNFRIMFDKGETISAGTRLLTVFSGGVLLGFASRLARGCTSGLALTGGAQLAISGWVFVVALFATGFIFASLARRLWR
jgi:uncharacterized membrane protein YedE/YeeE